MYPATTTAGVLVAPPWTVRTDDQAFAFYASVDSVTTGAAGITLSWTTDGLSLYRIWASENLTDWTLLDADLPGPSYLDTIVPERPRRFFRVERQ